MATGAHAHARDGDATERRLFRAFLVILVFFLVELAGGIYTNSLALLADAGHMFTDVLALGAAFTATRISKWSSDESVTYGYYRSEIIVAFLNGITLVLISLYIFYEAYTRLASPPEVKSGAMMLVAVVGLAANLVALKLLSGNHAHASLNLRAAFLHVVGDTLGSVGAIAAGAVMLTTGNYLADPAVGFLIGGIILFGSTRVVRDALDVLLQSVPKHVDVEEVKEAMESVEGVVEVHDLHVWSLKEGLNVLSSHVVVEDLSISNDVLAEMCGVLQRDFDVEHTTLQMEDPGMVGRLCRCEL
ncbi:MAG: Zinc transporter ZitB [Methanonatronarchaeales archaeon]|nr:Zinc transporter ZitB [Methanonatronarchaeales archaeon]